MKRGKSHAFCPACQKRRRRLLAIGEPWRYFTDIATRFCGARRVGLCWSPMRATLFTLMSVASCAVALAGSVYKWVDENGVTHYSDQPHENAQKVELKAPQTYSAPKSNPTGPAQPIRNRRTETGSGLHKLHIVRADERPGLYEHVDGDRRRERAACNSARRQSSGHARRATRSGRAGEWRGVRRSHRWIAALTRFR